MEGRRVTRKNQKYNPLFILFLCLTAAVAILLILSLVLGIRLGSANKKLKAADEKVAELTETVSRMQAELDAAKLQPGADASTSPADGEQSGVPGTSDDHPAPADGGTDGWLDLTGHSEVKVKPTNLLGSYATYYTTAGVNLRGGPATSYTKITTVDYGEKVQVAAKENGWSFVKYGSKFGWISSDYLSTSQPAAQSSSSSSSSSSSGSRTEATSGSLRR